MGRSEQGSLCGWAAQSMGREAGVEACEKGSGKARFCGRDLWAQDDIDSKPRSCRILPFPLLSARRPF